MLAGALVIPPRSQFYVLISGNFVDYICLWPVILFSPCCQNQVPELLQVRQSVNHSDSSKQMPSSMRLGLLQSHPDLITPDLPNGSSLECNFFLMLKENRIISKGTWVAKGATWTKWKEELSNNCHALSPYPEFHFLRCQEAIHWLIKIWITSMNWGSLGPYLLFNFMTQ